MSQEHELASFEGMMLPHRDVRGSLARWLLRNEGRRMLCKRLICVPLSLSTDSMDPGVAPGCSQRLSGTLPTLGSERIERSSPQPLTRTYILRAARSRIPLQCWSRLKTRRQSETQWRTWLWSFERSWYCVTLRDYLTKKSPTSRRFRQARSCHDSPALVPSLSNVSLVVLER